MMEQLQPPQDELSPQQEQMANFILDEAYEEMLRSLECGAYALGRHFEYFTANGATDGRPVYRVVIGGNVLKTDRYGNVKLDTWDEKTGYYDPITAVQEGFAVLEALTGK